MLLLASSLIAGYREEGKNNKYALIVAKDVLLL